MSILSELKKRAGPRVQIRTAPSRQSNLGGDKTRLLLEPSAQLGDAFDIAHLLVQAGISVRGARKVVDALVDGHKAFATATRLADYTAFKRKMAKLNVATHRQQTQRVDIKALRTRLALSQEDFAGRYGIDLKSLRNWEQGRTQPDGAAKTLLQLIERDPEIVSRLLAS